MTDGCSKLDREIVILAAVWELIGSMVNFSIFCKPTKFDEIILRFSSPEASKLFIILLADLLSLPRDGALGINTSGLRANGDGTYIDLLRQVMLDPQFPGDPTQLRSALDAFADWLEGVAVVENVWFPTIERNGPLKVRRKSYLKMCGTISKHGFTRLGSIVKNIKTILSENGTDITDGQSYRTIPEFQEWFYDNVFSASATRVAWHLNEIRWGIYNYIWKEFRRSYKPAYSAGKLQNYTYDIPSNIDDSMVIAIYWDLMNDAHSPPYFHRFSVDRYVNNLY